MIDSGTLSGIFTAILLLLFVGTWIWAFSSRQRARFEEAARMPLEDDAAHGPLEHKAARMPLEDKAAHVPLEDHSEQRP